MTDLPPYKGEWPFKTYKGQPLRRPPRKTPAPPPHLPDAPF